MGEREREKQKRKIKKEKHFPFISSTFLELSFFGRGIEIEMENERFSPSHANEETNT